MSIRLLSLTLGSWANLRRKNTGRDEPHAVKYWGLGNEGMWPMQISIARSADRSVWGPWQVGNQRAEDYAEKARQWAHGLKLVDPSIKLVSCGHEVRIQSIWNKEPFLCYRETASGIPKFCKPWLDTLTYTPSICTRLLGRRKSPLSRV